MDFCIIQNLSCRFCRDDVHIVSAMMTSANKTYRIRPNAPTYPNGNDSKTHPKSSHDKFKTASNAEVCLTLLEKYP